MPVNRVLDPEYFMHQALLEAHKAELLDEVPIGAVIVCDGKIIARGHNRRETLRDVTHHAEMVAIRQACRQLKSWRLDGCDLYVTLEPCVMCAGAIVQARIHHVYFGADDPKAGAVGSITNIFAIKQNHQVLVSRGLQQAACSQILRDFFARRRQQNKATGSRASRRTAAIDAQSAELLAADKNRRTIDDIR
ncbi:MAG: tRNA adenosine(34) deaminase TadA [Eubacteriales bacterium]|nr:tRNA adenosine(34) deaminase TadA [Eubacteriales bacterium]